MSLTPLRTILVGQQSGFTGSQVPATAKFMAVSEGGATVDWNLDQYQAQAVGSLSPSKIEALVAHSGTVHVPLDGTYEDILYPLLAAFPGSVAGIGPGPYIWTFVPDLAATPAAVQSYTLALRGDAASMAWRAGGSVAKRLHITGEAGGIWKIETEYDVRQITNISLPSLPADRDVEIIRMADTLFKSNVVNGVMGQTTIAGVLQSFDLDIDLARTIKFRGGSLYPTTYAQGRPTATLTTRLELTSNSRTILSELLLPQAGASTAGFIVQRQIQIQATSTYAAEGGPGAGVNDVKIQFAGYLQSDPQTIFENDDGLAIVEFKWAGLYNSTFAQWLGFTVTNSVSVLV